MFAIIIAVYSNSPKIAAFNVFIFFLSMNVSYHMYTIYFSGFNPKSYMLLWYLITLLSLLLAYISWYSKGNGILSIIINIGIISTIMNYCFSVGIWYFDFRNIIYTTIFLITVLVLYEDKRKTIFSLLFALIFIYICTFLNITSYLYI